MSQVQQWYTRQDGLDKLGQRTVPMPTPGKGEVLVKVNTVSLNYRDTEVCMGLYGHHKSIDSGNPEPLVPCSDMCGVIVSVGPPSTSSSPSSSSGEEVDAQVPWSVGDRVLSTFNQAHLTNGMSASIMKSGLGLPLEGVLATHRVFPSTGLVRCPDYLSDEEAATLPIAAVTAWMAINQFRPLGQPGGKGEVILLQGTGGVATAGLQIAHAAGAEVIITSSSDSKLSKARALGANHTINYTTTPNWDEAVQSLTTAGDTTGGGVNIILETGGAQTLRKSFNCIAFDGIISCIGYLSGKQDEDEAGDRTNVNLLALSRTVTLKGIVNGPRDRFEEMLGFYDRHRIRPVVDRVFPFEKADEALKYLFSGAHFGKVVVRVQE